jgi:lysozyme
MAKARRKKKSTQDIWKQVGLIVLLVGGLAFSSYYIYIWWMEKRAGFAHYEEFGIALPTEYEIHGIDVSHHQDIIKWEAVKEMQVKGIRLGFAFMKATEGYSSRDWQFGRNWRKAREVGIPRGAYHFFLPNKNGKLQAENFISTVDLEKGDLPPVVDIEETYGVDPVLIRRRLKEFMNVIEEHYKVRPILYTYVDYYANVLGDDFDEYPLWVAHYIKMNRPRIDREWLFWQHNEGGKVNGILTPVDFDVFSGDSAKFRSLLVP